MTFLSKTASLLFFLYCLVMVAIGAQAQTDDCPANMLCENATMTVLAGTKVLLLSDTDWRPNTFIMENGSVIETQGYDLKLSPKHLQVKGTAVIRAFDLNNVPPPPVPQGGRDPAPSYDRGPNNGDGQGKPGRPGDEGRLGETGKRGAPAGTIVLDVSTDAIGSLMITNEGGPGGPGGQGGNGGDGGAGEQGTRAQTKYELGIPAGCASGPGYGGNGGDGGLGGRGGQGGQGGDGGIVVIRLPAHTALDLTTSVQAGPPGIGGPPGSGGAGGLGGFGGRGAVMCQGQVGERSGANGLPGRPLSEPDRQLMRGGVGASGRLGKLVQ